MWKDPEPVQVNWYQLDFGVTSTQSTSSGTKVDQDYVDFPKHCAKVICDTCSRILKFLDICE